MLVHKAIDVHAHFGIYDNGKNDSNSKFWNKFWSGDIDLVLSRATAVNIKRTIISSTYALQIDGGDPAAGNQESEEIAKQYPEVRFWAVLNPKISHGWKQVEKLIYHPQCMGIKIHPVGHHYEIKKEGARIFDFALKHGVVVLSHSGQPGAFPKDFVSTFNDYPEVTAILAHLGNSDEGDPSEQVRAIQHCKSSNVYVDTSSASSINSKLIEWTVKEIGSDRILFGTDSPCYFVASQKARIEYAEIPEKDKKNIFYENAVRIFKNKI